MNHKNEVTQFSRKCPKCGGLVYHQSKKDRDRREREGRTCGGKANLDCKVISKKQRMLLSEANMGQVQPWVGKVRRSKIDISKWNRPCPKCGIDIYYSDEEHLKLGVRKKTICDSCRQYVYKITWKDVNTPASIRQMRATKAGFKDWSEYCRMFPKWKRYKAEVWRHTYKSLRDNPTLENFHLRGKCGVPGAYQIDHITGVRHGFDHGIDPSKIGKFSNLRMIPWRDNLLKG